MKTNVKSYTDADLITRMMSLPSFRHIPLGRHLISVRASEHNPDAFDDKTYLFDHKTCLDVMPCTTHSGVYGLKNFHKWNKLGVAVTKADEIYYGVFQKSDGRKVKHHNGKVQCLRQVGKMKYYRDGNKDTVIDECGTVYEANYSTNIHPNSYKHKTGIRSWLIGRWSTGCNVINDLTKYFSMLLSFSYKDRITYTLLKEF